MILVWLVVIPMIAGLLAWIFGKSSNLFARWISVLGIGIDLVISVVLWIQHFAGVDLSQAESWLVQIKAPWITELGISFHLAIDGISLLLIILTALLGLISVIISWTEIQRRVAFFHFNIMWILAGILGVFMAMDLFLFYFFWEMMLIPMYFLIGIWGHENRRYAAIKFFIFTQASGLLMLLSILGLYFIHHSQTGVYTYNYFDLLGTSLGGISKFLMLGFFVAFAVKLPAFPFHPWLADAHTEAPTAGSVILAGLLLKTGAYGIIRFVLPLFPEASAEIATLAMILGVISIIYGAILAFAQTDLKRLVAYTSVSHMGFVLLALFAFNEQATQGAIMQMICHGFSTGALFILVGRLQELIHTRDMSRMGGLWDNVPRMSGIAMFFALASLGLPGIGNFVGEFLILIGSFQANKVLTIIAASGLVFAAIYSLWIIQQVFHGEKREEWKFPDLRARFIGVFAVMIIILVVLGLYPRPVIDTVKPSIDKMQRNMEAGISVDQINAETAFMIYDDEKIPYYEEAD
ncbi:MAG: NADH-quinone oxidoreductase subunit M [candidate division Zixibacteria bacterium]|nr:NADH-quinone oxidoreductase subunit M [Gammaproteobacteria bacterium]NIR63133.1 NADH-quinone oxidoreductase subunit M [candidate division Zixibacteria bacterium]NIS16274.1 NADH-quinone oxidoreductase subunit M [candidate division Zixibacteria bacterium]NIS45551.1 NADH-quinone oxidoreductase subunit M [candidate division Zixibacteria bacterium]NIU13278.1 NADH-quinone oxidoreductase subunit M [candidate division Zixibacteria bacterium]